MLFALVALASNTFSHFFSHFKDPTKRQDSNCFYGFMPDKGRLLVFGLMMFMTTGHVLMKVLACALLLRLSRIWFFCYLLCDMCLYYLYKLVRGDLRYFVRIQGKLGLIISFFARTVVKMVADL